MGYSFNGNSTRLLNKKNVALGMLSLCFLISLTIHAQTITPTTTVLNGFNTNEGIASNSQSVDVTSADLTEDITITVPANFEISIDAGATYVSNTTLIVTDINTTFTILVRVAASSVRGMRSETLSLSSTGTDANITVRSVVIPANSEILFSQTSTGGDGITSQRFTDLGGTVYSADDFVVPTGQKWQIQEVSAQGTKNADPIDQIIVRIWNSDGTNGLPGTVFYEEILTAVNGQNDPHLTLSLTMPPLLTAGTYWLSVTPILDFNGNRGRWFWERATAGTGEEFHLLDEENIFGSGDNWTAGNSFSATQIQLVFSIAGNNLNTWTGAIDMNWNNVDNWDTGTVPDNATSVLIPDVANAPVVSNTIQEVNNLTVEDGATVTINSGAGLSIHGTATVEGSGQVNIQRNTVDNLGLSTIGSPITAGTVEGLDTDFAFSFDETTNSFSDASGIITPGKGLFVGFDKTDASVSFSGTPNSGDVTVNLTNSTGNGFNLVANPYAAPISRAEFLNENGADVITGTIYLFDDGGSNVGSKRGGDYIAVNDMGTTTISLNGVDGSTGSTFDENTPIGSVQGFFVQAVDATETLNFSPEMQVTTSNSDDNFFREVTRQKSVIRLSLQGAEKTISHLYNDLIIGLDEQATSNPDDFALDAIKLFGNDQIAFYSMDESDNQFAIQALPLLSAEAGIKVPIGFNLSESGKYFLKVESFTDIGQEIIAFLHDRETGEVYELTKDFVLPLHLFATSVNKRFMISLVNAQSGIITFLDDTTIDSDLQLLNGHTSSLTIRFSHQAKAVIYDLNGKVVASQEIGFEEGIGTMPVSLTKGRVYILRVADEQIKFLLKD